MPWGVAAAVGGSIAGSVVSSALSPGTSGGGSGGSYYIPTGLSTADQQWQDLQTGNYNTYNQYALAPYGYTSLAEGIQANNAYGPQYQAAANAAGASNNALAADFSNQANTNWATQGALQQLGNQQYSTLANAGNQVYQTALDPQSALYNRSVQQLQDQTGATNSMYGLGSSAAGAGVANQALSNFNIDWQNQQLQRQLQGLQGLAGAYGQAGGTLNSLYSNAANYGQLAGSQASQIPGLQLASGQTPYQTGQSIAGASGQLGSQFGSYLNSNVYSPAQSIQGAAIPYMNYGQGAQSVPYQSQQQGAGAAGALVSQGINNAYNAYTNSGSTGFNAFGSTQSPGNYAGTGYGGYGLGSGAANSYTGGGNTYGFTLS
jgi:hypothetical protein